MMKRSLILPAMAAGLLLPAAPAIIKPPKDWAAYEAQLLANFLPGMTPSFNRASAAASPTWTATDGPAIQNIAFGPNDATFASVVVNNASGDTVVVCVSSSGRNIAGVTIGGDAMTKAVESSAGAVGSSLWYKTGVAYTTPNIVVTGGGALGFVGMTVGKLTGVTATPTGTGVLAYGYNPDPQLAGSVTVPASGFLIAVGGSETPGSGATWNNGTEDYDLFSGTSWRHTSGYRNISGAVQMSISGFNFAGFSIAAAAWGP